jgi:serine/threonine protein kinase/Tol biopolymer transport system component
LKLGPGDRLGSYEILSVLGAGGMGEVYRARDSALGRDVAIKVLPDFVFTEPDRLVRFEQEAKAAAALNHPNIVGVYQFGTYEDRPYLVTELLEGETLRDRLEHGPLPLRKTVDYGIQIAHGLAAAHKKGIVHRDLKPENLFLVKDGRVKILDFGVAKILQSDDKDTPGVDSAHLPTVATQPGVVLGTWGYMSPEQVRGQVVDQRSDIFALGAILHEMVTGKRTFGRPTSADTISAILHDEPAAISQTAPRMPLGLQRVIDRCLEKNADQRFQSASDMAFALEALSDTALTSTATRVQVKLQKARKRTALIVAPLAALAGAFVLGYWLAHPSSRPKASNYVQLTHDGQPKSLLGTDGARLFLGLGPFPYQGGAEMPTAGGEPRIIAMPSEHAVPLVLSPDGSNLLAVDGQGVPPSGPLWAVPVTGGSPRRLGDLSGETGSWSPDGRMLAYAKHNELFLANANGTESHKLCAVEGDINSIVWSPDGERLRLDASQTVGQHQFWEVSTTGGDQKRLLAGWHVPPDECCGRWTTDGEYFIFQSNNQIWVLRAATYLHRSPSPIQLTSSPMSLSTPIPSNDGKRLYVVGDVHRGELTRYDSATSQFLPFLAAISAEYAAFSKDGQWVTYVTYPEGTLWRSKVDGGERMQLTYPPMYPMLPRWSPDGKTIMFFEFERAGKASRIYEISTEGGTPRELIPSDSEHQVDPNWSPDGHKVVFAGNPSQSNSEIKVFEVATGKISSLPSSQGMFSPRWSPDGRYIGALSADSSRLMVFDNQTGKWFELAQGSFGWLNWSHDGQALYFLDQSGKGAVLRVRIDGHKTEQVLALDSFKTTGRYSGSLALMPDDSPLLLREAGTQDVYALDWEMP